MEGLLKEFIINNDKIDEKLFNGNASLATFSAKISICYYLGIISEYEYKTIETIRKIRNQFSHEIEIKYLEYRMIEITEMRRKEYKNKSYLQIMKDSKKN